METIQQAAVGRALANYIVVVVVVVVSDVTVTKQLNKARTTPKHIVI